MIRTQVYLTEELQAKIKLTALREKKAEALIIREVLEEGFEHIKPVKTAGQALLELADLGKKLGFKGPKDLSLNHDTYLYQE